MKKLLNVIIILFMCSMAFAIETKKSDFVPSVKDIEDEATRTYGEDMASTVQKLQTDVQDDIDFLWKEKIGSWEKAWVSGTKYDLNTAVTRGTALYICVSAHTAASGSEPGTGSSWSAYWNMMADHGVTDTDTNISTEIQIKGWVQFNGAAVIQDSYNVSGIVDEVGLGDYSVTWDTDFANDDYAVVFEAGYSSQAWTELVSLGVGTARVIIKNQTPTAFDPNVVCVIAIGDQGS